MGADTKIEWAHHTFNPWIGCEKVSAGCKNCYAEEMMDHRYGRVQWGGSGTRVVTSDSNWRMPLRWDREAAESGERPRVFCASLADVFEAREDLIPTRHRLMDLIYRTPNLDWLLLTKRIEEAYYWQERYPFRPNVWIGTSVENQETATERLPWLLRIPRIKFLSMEPLLGPVDLSWVQAPFGNINWVIVGGESGKNARPMKPEWVEMIMDLCRIRKIPFFFKQWGEFNAAGERVGKKKAGRLLKGLTFDEVPTL